MRLIYIESYSRPTRVATNAFWIMFLLSIPLYLMLYYFFFLRYIISEVPLFIPDSVFCIKYCVSKCLQIILFGNLLFTFLLFVLDSFSSKYIAKTIAYIIGVITFPMMVMLIFAVLWEISGGRNIKTMMHVAPTGIFGAVLISLLPPFCRRRAHILVGLFTKSIKTLKYAIRYILQKRTSFLLLPVSFCTLYLILLYLYRMCKNTIQISAAEEIIHNAICISGQITIRALSTYSMLFYAFKLPDTSADKRKVEKIVTVLAALLFIFLSSTFFTCFKSASFYSKALMYAITIFINIITEWIVLVQIFRLSGAFSYVQLERKSIWIMSNRMQFLYFDLCRFFIMIFCILLPLTIIFCFFGMNGETLSEISIYMSFKRMTFGYLYAALDSVLKTIFLGQKLALPQRAVQRVTYTDIAHIYRHSSLLCESDHAL